MTAGRRPINCKRKGFTLIELLVVIAIIALLVSILIPSLQRVRRHTMNVVCQSQLKQWGYFFSMYTRDNKGTFPSAFETLGYENWINALRPYYSQEPDVRFCPRATKTIEQGGRNPFAAWTVDGTGVGYYFAKGDSGSYGLNDYVYNPSSEITHWNYEHKNFWRTVEVRGASNIPLFADCWWWAGSPDNGCVPPEYDGDAQFGVVNFMKRFCINRHEGHINSLFMDFSVREAGLKELWRLKWHRTFDTSKPPVQGEWPSWMKNLRDYD